MAMFLFSTLVEITMSMFSMVEVLKVTLLLSNGETSILWSMLSLVSVLETSCCSRDTVKSDFAAAASDFAVVSLKHILLNLFQF